MASDFPTDVPELHRRLTLAREKFAEQDREIRRLTALVAERQALYAFHANVSVEVLRILRGDGDTGLDDPVCREARELAGVAARSVTNQRGADGARALLRRLLAFLEAVQLSTIVPSIGEKQEAVRLLSQIRTEVSEETGP